MPNKPHDTERDEVDFVVIPMTKEEAIQGYIKKHNLTLDQAVFELEEIKEEEKC